MNQLDFFLWPEHPELEKEVEGKRCMVNLEAEWLMLASGMLTELQGYHCSTMKFLLQQVMSIRCRKSQRARFPVRCARCTKLIGFARSRNLVD